MIAWIMLELDRLIWLMLEVRRLAWYLDWPKPTLLLLSLEMLRH